MKRLIALALALLVLSGAGGLLAPVARAQYDPAVAEAVLDSLAAHPDVVSLALVPLGGDEPPLLINAEVQSVLASTVKILVLAEYARQVEAGLLDPAARVPVADVEAFYFAGLDGGAHPAALQALRADGRATEGDGATLALDDVAFSMIRFSDNAATDYLLFRLGRANVENLGALGFDTDTPLPISGYTLFLDMPASVRDTLDFGSPIDHAWNLAARLRTDAAYRDEIRAWMPGFGLRVPIETQAELFVQSPRGSALAYAEVMMRLYQGHRSGEAVSLRMLELLDWPMDHAGIAAGFDLFATKGGALPGTLTSATLADAKPRPDGIDPAPVAMALFLDFVPLPLWLDWVQSFAQQQFELRLLADPAFRETVRARLGGG